jgi:hypothetical protein
MSTDLDKIAVNADAEAVAIEVTFSSKGFGPTAQSQLGNEKCFYAFKLTPRLKYGRIASLTCSACPASQHPTPSFASRFCRAFSSANNES